MSRYSLTLSTEEKYALERLRDTSANFPLRERAAAILKVAGGLSASEVARHRLLRPHKPRTVQSWVRNYKDHGISGLSDKPGRGRKPTFPPTRP